MLPDLAIVVIASWMIVVGDSALVDRAILGSLDEQEEIDIPAFAASYAEDHERRFRAPWALPEGVCTVDPVTQRAALRCPDALIDARSWEETEAGELASAAAMRGTGWLS